ncbi:uncharacterized protein LOC124945939 [Impatiens glandulifera]|uniref:uncharacterized protein LOC124945939 n=1 Tax=Impatiens glandulifera TaxID=253017 RepID=UPI001FB17CB0|nr:uncharacterized protein LOC124945939 [Impatiens glandulifera]XP_047342428.1 uncharacterized protein LOC124945939 [Impatiens glandulifera]XP_047342429.1 uncharacterized protein LOC124945939 [Impatiens glandulifera]XP_047342430.1 uncharacterized protein LOC124945939 [Impatiens glandulifera]XP_047342431.1 uncharacterized protein LOC124945939 [Impatiens glandulifera]XP_047342432.1 uncharacterized protein LOC124945939 [Impatiens glandulifera]
MIDDLNVFSSLDKDQDCEAALVEDMKRIPLSEMDSTMDEDEVRNRNELFSDKNNQPEMMVCYQENSYVIKDICIDEGIPKDKISGDDKNDDCESRIEKKIDIHILISKRDNEEIGENESCNASNTEKQKSIEDFNLNGNADELEYNQVPILKENLGSVTPAEDQLEMEKTFTNPDSNSKRSPTYGGNSRRHEEGGLDISNGESSFGPVSGLITYSGPISYAGSISIRSDSSTTSARSFAFPVLQCEWNSSPVRMVKADRRHYRRHRGWWKHGLLCCRF